LNSFHLFSGASMKRIPVSLITRHCFGGFGELDTLACELSIHLRFLTKKSDFLEFVRKSRFFEFVRKSRFTFVNFVNILIDSRNIKYIRSDYSRTAPSKMH